MPQRISGFKEYLRLSLERGASPVGLTVKADLWSMGEKWEARRK